MPLSNLQVPASSADDAWRDYEEAWLLITSDDAAARRLLEQAFVRFDAAGDTEGASCVAAAGVILIAARHADFRGLAGWLRRFEAAAPPLQDVGPRALRFHVAMLSMPALNERLAFDAPAVMASAMAAFDLLRSAVDLPADERLLHGKLLLDWLWLSNDRGRFQTVASLLTPAAADATASPYWVGVWWWRVGSVHAKFGDGDAARSCHDRAGQIARDAGVVELDYALLGEDLNEHIHSGALLAAGEAAARMRALAPAVNAAWQGHGLVYTARLHLLRVEPAAAVQLCRAALELYAGCEVSEREQDVGRSTLAYALLLLGDADECLRMLEGCRPNQTGGQRAMLETQILAVRAWLALRAGSAEFDELLRHALRSAAAIHAHHVLYFLPQQAAALFEAALAREIEVEFVTHAIRIRRLAPPDPADARWPWRLRVRVLGGYSIERDGVPLGVARKAQKKPEELLKAIVAAGGDAEVDHLIDQLWPDQEAKDPRASFDMAVSRLRKSLGVEGALVLADGRLAFDRRVVWCDAQAFETLRLRLHDALSRMSEVEVVVSLTEQLVTLYKGPLFGAGAVAPWMLAPRERLAMAWQRAVQDAGAWLESRSQWRTAIVLYERAVAHQMLAEPVYRGLMRCHFAVGERAEGLIVYRRCRDLLSRVLGVEPGTETSRLHQRLLSDAERGDGA